MITREEKDLLLSTPLVMPRNRDMAANRFYDTLFKLSPELRTLFPAQMTDQARKFSATLVVAIHSFGDWASLSPVVEALARRHLGYGVLPEHYEQVGKALISTLESFDATPDELAMWRKLYEKLSTHMINTAYPPEATSA